MSYFTTVLILDRKHHRSMPQPLTPTASRACFLLSELFLDTTLSEAQKNNLSREIHTLGLCLPELLDLLRNDVFPACYHNLYEVAGEWAGFDQIWLERRINSWRRCAVLRWANESKVEQAWKQIGEDLVEEVTRIWKLIHQADSVDRVG